MASRRFSTSSTPCRETTTWPAARLEFAGPGRFRDVFEPDDSPVPAPQHDWSTCGHEDHDDRGRGLVRLPFNMAYRLSDITPSETTSTTSISAPRPATSWPSRRSPGFRSWTPLSDSSTPRGTCCWPTTMAASASCRGCWCRSRWTDVCRGGVDLPGPGLHRRRREFGRYVLNISSYRAPPAVGDDASVEVALSTFTFPFQGDQLVERVRQRQRQPDVRRWRRRLLGDGRRSFWPDRPGSRRSGTI